MIKDYQHLSIGKYMEITAFCKDESLTDIDRQAEILAVLNDVTTEEVLDVPIVEYKQMVIDSRFLEEMIPVNKHIANKYKIGSWELVPTTDVKKITTAQYTDFQEYSKQGVEEHFVECLSCFLVPKGHKYCKDYDVVALQSAIRDGLMTTDVVSLLAFFLKKYKALIKGSLTFSEKMLKGMTPETEMKRAEMERIWNKITESLMLLENDGDGSR